MTPLRPPAIAELLVMAVVVVLISACAPEVTETIGAARELAGDIVADPEPPKPRPEQPVAVDPSTEPPEVHATESPEVDALLVSLRGLSVAARGSAIEYDRRDWGQWIDADRDCQNTRAEVLIAESMAPVSFAPEDDGDECRVITGMWVGPWTGEVFTDASDLDIDHHVPLGHAHLSGGWDWPPERKRAYTNDLADPVSLQATSASVNRSKGKQPPDEWRPDESAGWCRYAANWIVVKERWELTVTAIEVHALEEMLSTCDDPSSWGLSGPHGAR